MVTEIYSQIFSPKVIFLLSKKLLSEAIPTAMINDIAYWISAYSTKAYTNDNCMTAPNEHRVKNSEYCLIKCLVEKSRSSKVHTLFNRKFVVIETSIPIRVAWIYQMLANKFEKKYETA